MKQLILPLLVILAFAAHNQAQRKLFDPNDLIKTPQNRSGGVNMAPSESATARAIEKTALVTLTVHDGQPDAAPRLTSTAPSLSMGTGNHLRGFSTGDPLIDSYIVESSHRCNIDPLLIYMQMAQESAFKVNALSHKGASGLMQLMPATARRMGVTDIYDPPQNIEGGVKYMRLLLDMFGGDLKLALAGYNAGEGAVIRYGYKVPPFNETRDYVRRISARYEATSNAAPRIGRTN